MLGSLIYILILLAVILIGGFALNFLVQSDGLLVLHYGDRLYEVTLFEAAILLILLILAIYIALAILRLIIALIRFIAGDETAFGHFFVRSRERRGLRALSDAYLALAAGDSKKAEKKAKKAELTLRHPELTRIVNAQAAELAGDTDRARMYYRALLEDPRTAFVGTRGLLHIALERGDNERALKLAEHAHGLRPKDRETMETLYMLQSQAFDWAAARRTLAAQAKAGYLPVAEGRRRDAALALAQSEDATALGDAEQARALAAEAAELDPANTAAVTTAAKLLLEAGNKRQATKLIISAWRAQPRPQLAAAFAAIEPDEAPAARRRRFEALFSTHPDNAETHFLRAELALVERDWNSAEAAIKRL
ncbi:MAG TPA: heme biosynthesis HemY N-terminal domain-containing protein, partial [Paracoccaceae bacterium]|nr:heme biosynthesis HemY N-terminal domain-containing protein [Paracoccaceae bacterium]